MILVDLTPVVLQDLLRPRSFVINLFAWRFEPHSVTHGWLTTNDRRNRHVVLTVESSPSRILELKGIAARGSMHICIADPASLDESETVSLSVGFDLPKACECELLSWLGDILHDCLLEASVARNVNPKFHGNCKYININISK
jgi:hypothetical protein